MEKIARDDVLKMLHISEGELSKLGKAHLEYRKDYFMHPKDGMRYSVDAVKHLKEILRPENKVFDAEPNEIVVAKVCKTLPANPRFLWIHVPGFDGKGVCQIPQRYVRQYRIPGKRITVRHVKDKTFQFARVNLHEKE